MEETASDNAWARTSCALILVETECGNGPANESNGSWVRGGQTAFLSSSVAILEFDPRVTIRKVSGLGCVKSMINRYLSLIDEEVK